MIKVRFFGRVREELDCDSLDATAADLDSLQDALIQSHGEPWRVVLGQENIIRAVNHTVVAGNCSLSDGDEVAFFPPVTGG